MSAVSLFDEPPASPVSFSLFSPPDSADWASRASAKSANLRSDTRITNPGLGQMSPLELLEQLREGEKEDVPEVDDDARNYFRTTGTVAEFYLKILDPWRKRQRALGRVAPGTLTNERQSIRCFEEFDRFSRPKEWPLGVAWNGRPMGFLGSNYFRDWITYRLEFGSRNGPLSDGSMPKRWNHMRFVVNQAFRLRIIPDQISISVKEVVQQWHEKAGLDPLDDLDFIPTAFTDQQLQGVYQQLDGDIEQQTAWVLGSQTGPRTGDLFALRWQKNVRLSASPADILFVAEKTKRKARRIWVPLGPIAIEHLQRLAKQQAHLAEPQGLVFPRLTDGQRKDPEDGERSRARTRRVKRAMIDAGLEVTEDTRPFQILRATCNSRLNGIETGAGDRATHGPASTVQGQSYNDYRDMLIRAVMQLDQQRQAARIFARR